MIDTILGLLLIVNSHHFLTPPIDLKAPPSQVKYLNLHIISAMSKIEARKIKSIKTVTEKYDQYYFVFSTYCKFPSTF